LRGRRGTVDEAKEPGRASSYGAQAHGGDRKGEGRRPMMDVHGSDRRVSVAAGAGGALENLLKGPAARRSQRAT